MDSFRRLLSAGLACLLGMTALNGCGSGRSAGAAVDGTVIVRKAEQHLSADPAHGQLRALVVLAAGRTVVEKYYGGATASSAWDVESVTKSIVSTLVGIAIGDGTIPGVDATLAELLPEYRRDMTPATARVTLGEVLSMTAGFPEDDLTVARRWQTVDDPARYILRHRDPDLEGFAYSNQGAQLVAAILTRATGMPVLAYARTKLFGPLGIPSRPAFTGLAGDAQLGAWTRAAFAWPVDPAGIHLGWGLVKMRAVDLLKLGRLYLQGGRWHGRQVVPKAWVRQATSSKAVDALMSGYGYEWWLTEADGAPAYLAAGFGGQIVEVVPERNLVVVMLTEIDPLGDGGEGLDWQGLAFLVSDAIAPLVH